MKMTEKCTNLRHEDPFFLLLLNIFGLQNFNNVEGDKKYVTLTGVSVYIKTNMPTHKKTRCIRTIHR